MKSTLIVGNGLGMALDPNHFNLQTGLAAAWNSFNEEEQLEGIHAHTARVKS